MGYYHIHNQHNELTRPSWAMTLGCYSEDIDIPQASVS